MGSTFSQPISRALHELQSRLKADLHGTVASYIPELSKADPKQFGLTLASLEGHVYQAGDADVPFTIQSVSKPFVYALALADRGADEVSCRVGVEPSGEPFNAISLEPLTGRPANPMINAGAIVTGSLVRAANPVERFDRIREVLSKFAGRRLELDEAVYASELETGDRNRALAYLMRNTGLLQSPVDEAVDVYFRQCAVLVTAHDLAVMAATLANGGVNPCTGVTVVQPQIAEQVLSVMATCGMYDYSGEWLLRVGLPAKSGVSGALVAVSPSQFGIGLFSPPLDDRGNTVRGIAACRELSDRFRLHLMHNRSRTAPAIHFSGSGSACPSSRIRRRRDRDVLLEHGDAIHVISLQGEIDFAAAEAILWSLEELARTRREELGWLALDLHRMTRLDSVASDMLNAAMRDSAFSRTTVAVADTRHHVIPSARIELPSLAEALEWCEDALLERHGGLPAAGEPLSLDDHDLMAPLGKDARDQIAAALTARRRGIGESVFDDVDDVLCLVLGGRVAVFARASSAMSTARRLASFGPGTTIGGGGSSGDGRTRDFVAEVPTAAMVLTRRALERLGQTSPQLVGLLWRLMTASVTPQDEGNAARDVPWHQQA